MYFYLDLCFLFSKAVRLQERKIIRLQSIWRGRQSRKMFQQLVHQANPSLAILRQFVSILSPCVDEFQKENEIQVGLMPLKIN
jgi:hypothetical protein